MLDTSHVISRDTIKLWQFTGNDMESCSRSESQGNFETDPYASKICRDTGMCTLGPFPPKGRFVVLAEYKISILI